MKKKLVRNDVIALMKKEQGERSLREFASDLGVSPAYLSDVYRGNRAIGPKLLRQFRLQKSEAVAVTYQQVSAS